MMESSGYLYTRIWTAPITKGMSSSWDRVISRDADNRSEWRVLMNPREDFGEFHHVAIGQTTTSVKERYRGAKSIKPMREWNVSVEEPRKCEDKLRQSFKWFLSDKSYSIIPNHWYFADSRVLEFDLETKLPGYTREERSNAFHLFCHSRQESDDVFTVPIFDSMTFDPQGPIAIESDKSLRVVARILLYTFFDAYFDSLSSQFAVSIRQGDFNVSDTNGYLVI